MGEAFTRHSLRPLVGFEGADDRTIRASCAAGMRSHVRYWLRCRYGPHAVGMAVRASWFETALSRLLTMRVRLRRRHCTWTTSRVLVEGGESAGFDLHGSCQKDNFRSSP